MSSRFSAESFPENEPRLPKSFISINQVGNNAESAAEIVFKPVDLLNEKNRGIFMNNIAQANNLFGENDEVKTLDDQKPLSLLVMAMDHLHSETFSYWFSAEIVPAPFKVLVNNNSVLINSNFLVITTNSDALNQIFNTGKNIEPDLGTDIDPNPITYDVPSILWARAMELLNYSKKTKSYSNGPVIDEEIEEILKEVTTLHDLLIFLAYSNIEWDMISGKTARGALKDKLRNLNNIDIRKLERAYKNVYDCLHPIKDKEYKGWEPWDRDAFNRAQALLEKEGVNMEGDLDIVYAKSLTEYSFSFKNAAMSYVEKRSKGKNGSGITQEEYNAALKLSGFYTLQQIKPRIDYSHDIYYPDTKQLLRFSTRPDYDMFEKRNEAFRYFQNINPNEQR